MSTVKIWPTMKNLSALINFNLVYQRMQQFAGILHKFRISLQTHFNDNQVNITPYISMRLINERNVACDRRLKSPCNDRLCRSLIGTNIAQNNTKHVKNESKTNKLLGLNDGQNGMKEKNAKIWTNWTSKVYTSITKAKS